MGIALLLPPVVQNKAKKCVIQKHRIEFPTDWEQSSAVNSDVSPIFYSIK